MPALKPVPGVIKFRMHTTYGSDTTTGWHMFYAYGAQPPTAANVNATAQATFTSYASHLAALAQATVQLTEVEVTDLSSPTGFVGIATGTSAGTRTGSQLPAQTCLLQSWKIQRRYRGGKPRWYLPFGTTTDLQTAQQWTPAFISAAGTALGLFDGDIRASINSWGTGAALVNVSYYSGHTWAPDQNGNYHRVPTPRPVPVVDPIVSAALSNTVASQRRRVRPK